MRTDGMDPVARFLERLQASFQGGTFAKLSLGKHRGGDPTLRNVTARRIRVREEDMLSFTYRYQKGDIVKNLLLQEAVEAVRALISADFLSGHLYTLEEDMQLEFNRRREPRLSVSAPTVSAAPDTAHDRAKTRHLDIAARHWQMLGIADGAGRVRERMGDKWKQVNKFAEVLASLVASSEAAGKEELAIVDMGSGKGYLAFAAYEYVTRVLGRRARVTGVEARAELVALCEETARECGLDGLGFVHGTIKDAPLSGADIVLALHACDTATDEALYRGIAASASLIICAPCCYREIRPQVVPPAAMQAALRHGTLLERQAEILTDAIRALLLESAGYAAKVFEFASPEETLKNVMIAGTRRSGPADPGRALGQVAALKELYGIREQALERLLAGQSGKA